MTPTTALTGALPAVLILAALLTAVFSALLLGRYRAATLAAMKKSAGVAEPPVDRELPGPSSSSQLRIENAEPGRTGTSLSLRAVRRAGAVYTTAGLVYALIMTLPWMIGAGGGFPIGRFLWLMVCFAWPIPILVSWAVSIDRGGRARIYGAYFVALAGIGVFVVARNPDFSLVQGLFLWFFFNAAPTVLFLAFNRRRVRAVGPLVLAFMACGVLGAFLFIAMAAGSDNLLRALVEIGVTFDLGARSLFVLLHFAGFLVFGVLGWKLLGRLGRAYRKKRFSDQSLGVDSTLLVFGVTQSITLAFEHPAWILTGLVAFFAFRVVSSLGWRLLEPPASPRRLLLLRVFSLGRRSEGLFDSFSKAWRRRGPIHLIAGPDLVTSIVEPHEFLDFVGGKLSRHYVSGAEDLDRRIEALDLAPDPDGRFRVNEFFCRADTWKQTMRRLAAESDVVLMDLRSFSHANRGCLYEIEQLVHHVPLGNVVLLLDQTTERSFLEQQLQEMWARLPAESPNRNGAAVAIRVHESVGRPSAAVRPLLSILGA